MIIYLAVNNINGKVYVGQTILSLNERIGDHRRKSNIHNSKSYFHSAIRKYGFDSFQWLIIDKAANRNELNNKEMFWIKYYNSSNKKYGYNLENGGGNKSPNIETRKKISMSQKGIKRSEEFKKKISKATKGERNPFYGKHHTAASRIKCGIKNIGRKLSKEHIEKCRHLGENNWRANLKTHQVIKIKKLLQAGERIVNIAKIFNVTPNTIKMIKYNISWKHIKI